MSTEQFVYSTPDGWNKTRFSSWQSALDDWTAHHIADGRCEIAQAMQNNEGGWMLRPNTFHYFVNVNRYKETPVIDVWYRGRPLTTRPLPADALESETPA